LDQVAAAAPGQVERDEQEIRLVELDPLKSFSLAGSPDRPQARILRSHFKVQEIWSPVVQQQASMHEIPRLRLFLGGLPALFGVT
jgi:hypothetical protein